MQANNDIVKQTNFNGNPLLQGGSPLGFQSGANAGQQTSLAAANLAAANLAAAPASGGLFSLAGGIDLSSAAKAKQPDAGQSGYRSGYAGKQPCPLRRSQQCVYRGNRQSADPRG